MFDTSFHSPWTIADLFKVMATSMETQILRVKKHTNLLVNVDGILIICAGVESINSLCWK